MNPMNLRRRLAAGVLLGIVFIALQFLVHGCLLSGSYKETESVWRLESEMKSLFGLMIAAQFIFGVFFGVVFAQGYEPRRAPIGQGFRYGLIMGSMLAPMNSLVWYVLLPVPMELAAYWLAASFFEMVALGIIASFVYKP